MALMFSGLTVGTTEHESDNNFLSPKMSVAKPKKLHSINTQLLSETFINLPILMSNRLFIHSKLKFNSKFSINTVLASCLSM